MGLICADTSFLVSLYGNDSHTQKAVAYARGLRRPVAISQLNEFEFEQALQLSIFRKIITPALAARAEATLQADFLLGKIEKVTCNFTFALLRAQKLSRAYTPKLGCRSLDMLHVGVALELSAQDFLTFDAQQARLAQAEKLKVNP